MKNNFLFIVLTLFVTNSSIAQKTESEWKVMIDSYRSKMDILLERERPRNLDIVSFKKAVGKGDILISETAKQQIEENTIPLIDYGRELAVKNNLDITDKDELLYIASFRPSTDLNEIYTIDQNDYNRTANGPSYQFEETTKLDGRAIFNCALAAIGVDAAYALSQGAGTSWSIAALRTTFTNVAKRFLGPIGVAWAVGSFAFCLYES
ncbi:hypothetical protein [Ferruginibacter sp.]